jgi:hypothetical protein
MGALPRLLGKRARLVSFPTVRGTSRWVLSAFREVLGKYADENSDGTPLSALASVMISSKALIWVVPAVVRCRLKAWGFLIPIGGSKAITIM